MQELRQTFLAIIESMLVGVHKYVAFTEVGYRGYHQRLTFHDEIRDGITEWDKRLE